MRPEIHPKYIDLTVTCSCGFQFVTRSTFEPASNKSGEKEHALHVEVCSECHPFYTGKQKVVDTSGRVDRFLKRYKQKN